MSPELIPEDNSCRSKTIAGYAVGITSYQLGSTFYPKAGIHLPEADARLAAEEDITREVAEDKLLGWRAA
jgi:hypothetical protein